MPTHEKARQSNRLINESSPYLLQHAYNPVDWYPWSDEALKAAKDADKPIFLSIGYSTCHWCHVMAHESFENPEIAEILNTYFIAIKVDREQRPDIDDVYMTAVRMMTGSGGWPLSVFLMPDGKPFYGGTYFPPEDRYGRIGFKKLLNNIADAWQNRRDELSGSAAKISGILAEQQSPQGEAKLNDGIVQGAAEYLKKSFDHKYAGFGSAPKFPQPSRLSLLLRYYHRWQDRQVLEMIEKTLDAMAKGGIYDHLAGGFHRYSVDKKWLVPHFEKMLYDQGLLARAYLQAYQITGKERYAQIAREILDYVLSDMVSEQGGFYSAEDADSEGEEGVFYVWTPKEIQDIVGDDTAKIFNDYYGVTKRGNFEHGKSILNVNTSLDEFAKKHGKQPEQIEKILSDGRGKLLKARSKRPRPHRDEKIITAWNGLMISAFAYGGGVLGEVKYTAAAQRCGDFIVNNLVVNNRLMRYYAKEHPVEPGFLDDYAFLIVGLIDLYQVSFETKYLAHAKVFADQMIKLFGDPESGTFYLTGSDGERLIVRTTPDYDGAVPSGNSFAAMALLRLGEMTGDPEFSEAGAKLLHAFADRLNKSPLSFTEMLMAVDYYFGPRQEIVIAGRSDAADTKEMLKVIRGTFLPNAVILLHDERVGRGEELEKLAGFVKNQNMIGGKATAYVCENYVCNRPVNTLGELRTLITGKSKVLTNVK